MKVKDLTIPNWIIYYQFLNAIFATKTLPCYGGSRKMKIIASKTKQKIHENQKTRNAFSNFVL